MSIPNVPLEAYLQKYIELGFRVFPVQSSNKRPPPGFSWSQQAVSDYDEAISLWDKYPEVGVAICTGPESDIWVLDIDEGPGKVGSESWVELLAASGLSEHSIDTLRVDTPSGGSHLYFRWDKKHSPRNGTGIRGFKNIDRRGQGGYVVAPPTQRSEGGYRFRGVGDVRDLHRDLIKPAPEALLRVLFGTEPSTHQQLDSTPRTAGPEIEREGASDGEVERIRSALSVIPSDDRTLWARVGLMLAFYLPPDAGWRVFDEWSRKSSKYEESENIRQWESFRFSSRGKWNPDWLFNLARLEYSWSGFEYRDPIPTEVAEVVTLAEAPSRIRDQILLGASTIRAKPNGGMGLLYAEMGLGKSRALAEALVALGGDVVIAVRNHKLLDELARIAERSQVPIAIHRGVEKECQYKDVFVKQGRPPEWKKSACKGCPSRTGCRVHAIADSIQEGTIPPAVLTVHAAVRFLPPSLRDRLVIFDEAPEVVEKATCTLSDVSALLSSTIEGPCDPEDLRLLFELMTSIERNIQRLNPQPQRGKPLQRAIYASDFNDAVASSTGAFALSCGIEAMAGAEIRTLVAAPDAVRNGDQLVVSHRKAIELAAAIASVRDGVTGIALSLEESKGSRVWVIRRRIPAPRHSLILDGTAESRRLEMRAWTGHDDTIFGVTCKPPINQIVRRILFKGKKFNRGRLRGKENLDAAATYLVQAVRGLLTKHFLHQRDKEVLAVIVPKVLHDYIVKYNLLPPECMGYFGSDEIGVNRFEGRRFLVTAGDNHGNVFDLHQQAECLGIDGDRLVNDRRCAQLLQASARPRWIRQEGEFLDVHFGMALRPGWLPTDCEIIPQPNKPREQRNFAEECIVAFSAMLRAGMPVTADVAGAMLSSVGHPMAEKTARKYLVEAAVAVGCESIPAPSASGRGKKQKAFVLIQPAAPGHALSELPLLRRLVPRWQEFSANEATMGGVAEALVAVVHQSRVDPSIAIRLGVVTGATLGSMRDEVPEVSSLNIAG
jgi:hypothetical protein